jgi:hypothetical protein
MQIRIRTLPHGELEVVEQPGAVLRPAGKGHRKGTATNTPAAWILLIILYCNEAVSDMLLPDSSNDFSRN